MLLNTAAVVVKTRKWNLAAYRNLNLGAHAWKRECTDSCLCASQRCTNSKPRCSSQKNPSERKSVSGMFNVQRPSSAEYIATKEIEVKHAPWSTDEAFLLANIISKDMSTEEAYERFVLHQRCIGKLINAREMQKRQVASKYKLMKIDWYVSIIS